MRLSTWNLIARSTLALVISTSCEFKNSKSDSASTSGLLSFDVQRILSMTLEDPSSQMATVTGIPDSSVASLNQYLFTNVNYIVPEMTESEVTDALSDAGPFAYPDLRLFDEGGAIVLMFNLGAGLYMSGKDIGRLIRFQVPNGGPSISITSPRAGLLMVGPGLYDENYIVNPENPDSIANAGDRVATLFHEARHSDGHDAGSDINSGFPHELCPAGHPLAGIYACDSCSNGAYAVGAAFLDMFIHSCTADIPNNESCTDEEEAILDLFLLDSRSRQLSGASSCDPAPEGSFTPVGNPFLEF